MKILCVNKWKIIKLNKENLLFYFAPHTTYDLRDNACVSNLKSQMLLAVFYHIGQIFHYGSSNTVAFPFVVKLGLIQATFDSYMVHGNGVRLLFFQMKMVGLNILLALNLIICKMNTRN